LAKQTLSIPRHWFITKNLLFQFVKLFVDLDHAIVLGNFDIGESRQVGTKIFWDAVRNSEIVAIVSDVFRAELKDDNIDQALRFLATLPKNQIEQIIATDESDNLAEQYIAATVVGRGSFNDCRHVALATILADGIVSWNLGDMVKRADKYNSVNVAQGYPEVKIVTPITDTVPDTRRFTMKHDAKATEFRCDIADATARRSVAYLLCAYLSLQTCNRPELQDTAVLHPGGLQVFHF